MKQAFFWCYPWDLEAEGTEAALARMAGDIGTDAVSVATTLYGVEQFRPRAPAGQQRFVHDAAAHFQPDGKLYTNTRIRPVAAGWMKSRNPLDKIARAAQKENLGLRAWTVCCHSSALAAKHPLASCVDVFGNPMGTWLCPANPEVREYLAALVEDLSRNYPLEAIELEAANFGDGPHYHRHYQAGVAPGPVERVLLWWCFCPSCRQRAEGGGIEVESVVASVRGCLDRMFRLERPAYSSIEEALEADEHLAAYFRMRCEAVTSLLASLRRQTNVRLLVHVDSSAWDSGANIARLSEHCDGFVATAADYGSPAWSERVDRLVQATGTTGRVDLGLACCPPRVSDGPALVAATHRAAQSGYAGVGFCNYGLAPEPCLDWVRQAIRFARRETAS
jgi:hypothetical protein